MRFLLCAALALTLPTMAAAQDDETAARLARVEVIKGQIAAECVAMNEAEAEDELLPLEETDLSLRWFDDSIYDIEISPEGRKATVIYRDASCPNFGSAFCGSGGCKFFIVVGSQAFSYELGGKPYPVAHGDGVSIAVPLGGYACKDTKGTTGFGTDPCYDFFFWNDRTEDFMSLRQELVRLE